MQISLVDIVFNYQGVIGILLEQIHLNAFLFFDCCLAASSLSFLSLSVLRLYVDLVVELDRVHLVCSVLTARVQVLIFLEVLFFSHI